MSLSNVNVNDFGSVYVENVCFKNAIESMCPVSVFELDRGLRDMCTCFISMSH